MTNNFERLSPEALDNLQEYVLASSANSDPVLLLQKIDELSSAVMELAAWRQAFEKIKSEFADIKKINTDKNAKRYQFYKGLSNGLEVALVASEFARLGKSKEIPAALTEYQNEQEE